MPLVGEGFVGFGSECDWGVGVICAWLEDAKDCRVVIVCAALVVPDAVGGNNVVAVDHGVAAALEIFLDLGGSPQGGEFAVHLGSFWLAVLLCTYSHRTQHLSSRICPSHQLFFEIFSYLDKLPLINPFHQAESGAVIPVDMNGAHGIDEQNRALSSCLKIGVGVFAAHHPHPPTFL